jgi:D-alanyl-D-alanine carboxypeptidase
LPCQSESPRSWRPPSLLQLLLRRLPCGKARRRSNTNYVLLGLIVEAATGRPIAEELERRIFRPLRLWATTFDTDGRFGDRSNGRRIARFAHG